MKNTAENKPSITKGDWKIQKELMNTRIMVNDNQESICTVHRQRDEDGMFNHDHKANAYLISASPDMYKALKVAEGALHEANVIQNGRWNREYLKVKQAIAKAEGGND